jgi:hypothetical protein
MKFEPIQVKSGGILHVKVGLTNLGDGQGPWMPSPDDLESVRTEIEQAIPEGTTVIVTHCGVSMELVK